MTNLSGERIFAITPHCATSRRGEVVWGSAYVRGIMDRRLQRTKNAARRHETNQAGVLRSLGPLTERVAPCLQLLHAGLRSRSQLALQAMHDLGSTFRLHGLLRCRTAATATTTTAGASAASAPRALSGSSCPCPRSLLVVGGEVSDRQT